MAAKAGDGGTGDRQEMGAVRCQVPPLVSRLPRGASRMVLNHLPTLQRKAGEKKKSSALVQLCLS